MKNKFFKTTRSIMCRANVQVRLKTLCTVALVGAATTASFGQTPEIRDSVRVQHLQKVVISDSRVGNTAPLTTTTINRNELLDVRSSVSMPFMLELQPSVVAMGENGAVGATSLRIRGVDATRINVNINGITLNDPESQAVFWYNIPNLGGMAQSLQIQRGVGASTGGSPAFGAAINLQTLNARNRAYGEADFGLGSWNTRQYSITAGTGIMKNGLSFDFAYSGLTSDGFVRSRGTDQQSFFGCASWYGERTLVKMMAIIGSQTTGITWDGAYASQLDIDPTYNPSGEYVMDGNIMYYPNETDNYWQRHYQLYVSHMLSDNLSVNAALDFTHGDGYYEQYKADTKYKKIFLGSGRGDYITRKQMDNNAITGNLAIRYAKDGFSLSVGHNMLYFDGFHFGNVLWFRDTAMHIDTPYQWYRYNGTKTDNTSYLKFNYDITSDLNIYGDLQMRIVNYRLRGTTDDATHDDGLRLVGKCQSADRVVEVVHTLCRITAVVQEGVTLLLDEDGMFADADGDGELTVLVGGDFLAPFVFHHDIVHTEATALNRIGGVLVIHHALHIEAAVVGKVLRVERECLGRHIQRAGGRRETMGTLRRNQRIRCTLTGKRYAAQGVGAHRVRYGIERQLVGRRRLDIRAAPSHDVGMVLVGNIRCLRVVVGPAQRTDVLVEWPVGYETTLRTAHEMAVVLHHVGLSETALEETYLVDVTVNSLCAVCCRGYGDASGRVGSRQWTVESQLVSGDAAQRVGSHQINLRLAVAVVGKGDMGKLVGFDAVGGLPGVTTSCRRDEVTLGGIIVGEP